MQPHVHPLPGSDPSAGPRPVPGPLPEPKSSSNWLILLLLILASGVGYYFWQSRQQGEQKAQATASNIRTATIQQGRVTKALRVTGVTAAGKFVSLIAPQSRGSRSGRGRGGFSIAGMQSTTVSSVSSISAGVSGAGSGGGSVAGSGSAAAAGAADAVSSSGGGGNRSIGGSGATRAASSRVSRPAAQASGGARAGSGSGSASASQGSDGLGSTSSQLGSGMGGSSGGSFGGGGGDFTLVLQSIGKPGSIVKKGDVVAEFDRQYMLQRLEDYKSTLETAKALLIQQRANLALARTTHDLNVKKAKATLDKAELDLRTLPVLSQIDSERARLALEEAQAQYKQQLAEGKFIDDAEKAQLKYAELEFKALELEYKRSEQNAERMVARAAIDGMIVMQNIMRGSEFAQIQAGDQVYPGQFYMQIVDPRSMVINATVNQVDAERLRVGSKAKVRFDAFPGLEVPAHVVNIAAVPRSGGFRASFVRDIPVLLKIDAMDTRIIPDLSCSVDVTLSEDQESAIAPVGAIFADAETGKRFVYVREGDVWNRREVEVGLETYLVASVRNLKKGDIVALEPPPSVSATMAKS
jgi:hypothetical protein